MVAGLNIARYDAIFKLLDYQHQKEEISLSRPRLALSHPVYFYKSSRGFPKYSFLFHPSNRREILLILAEAIPWIASPETTLTQLMCGLPFADNYRLEQDLFGVGCGLSLTFSNLLDCFSCMVMPALKAGYDLEKALISILQNFY